jgi:citrate synthase
VDIDRLAKRTPHSRLAPTDIVVPTSVSLVDGANGRLWYRGIDAVDAAIKHRFEAVAEFLWTRRWNGGDVWVAEPACVRAALRAQRALPRDTPPLDRLAVVVSAARTADPQRLYRSPLAVVRMGCNLLATIVDSLPALGPQSDSASFAERLWPLLTASEPARDRVALLDTTLGLGAEHGVTFSVVAARLAASAGADPYAAVGSALGPALAAVEQSRFPALEQLFAESERTGDADGAVAGVIEREGKLLGVSAEPYPSGDPRARPILESLSSIFPAKASVVDATVTALKRRGDAEPDLSFATAALSFAFGFASGSSELVTVVARIAGWIAHAIAEYRQPTPFRPHATYTGSLPPEAHDEPKLLHAVMNYLREG